MKGRSKNIADTNPIFVRYKDVYSVFARHADLAVLANLAVTTKLASQRFSVFHKKIFANPDLLFAKLAGLSREKLLRYLQQHGFMHNLITQFIKIYPNNYSAFALSTLITNVDAIDAGMLSRSIAYFKAVRNYPAVRTMKCMRSIKAYAANIQANGGVPAMIAGNEVFEYQESCYLNLQNIQLGVAHTVNGTPEIRSINLRYANLRGANLRHVYMSNVDLFGADLSGADLRYMYFDLVDCRDANFSGANFAGLLSKFFSVRLDGAKMMGAKFFPSEPVSIGHMEGILFTFPYLNDSIHHTQQDIINHMVLEPAVLHDLIVTVNGYVSPNVTPADLIKYKTAILHTALHHPFFNQHKTKLVDVLNHACKFGNTNSIYTPCQKIIKAEICRIESEYKASLRKK